MRKVRVGVHLNPQHGDYVDYRRAVLEVERLGADVITVWDHFYPLSGDPDGKHFECWTLLSAIAEMTERIEMGALVSAIGYRNPNLIADMSRTIDHISGGRFILGLGGGWAERDYREYGYEFGTPGSRLRALRDALPVIEERFTKLNPPPTRHIPIMIGGGGEKVTLRIVANHADIWHCNAGDDDLARKAKVLDEWCQKEGRDPASIERATGVGAKTSLDEADDMIEKGFTFFTYRSSGPEWELGPVKDWIAWRDQHNAKRG
jgi:probable F420-dependent oxidoreductase